MNFSNYTTKAAEAIQGAMQLAGELSHQAITPRHLFLVLIQQREGLVTTLLKKMERNPETLSADIKRELTGLPRVSGGDGA